MAVTYFGYCDAAGAGTGGDNIYAEDKTEWIVAGYACPDSGAQDLMEIGAETSDDNATTFRMGVYASGNLIVETSSAKAPAYPAAWVTWSDAELTWHSGTTLTGGTTYVIAISGGVSIRFVGTAVASGNALYVSTDYTSGMPSTLPGGSNGTLQANCRAGVQPAAVGGISIPIVMAHYRRLRN